MSHLIDLDVAFYMHLIRQFDSAQARWKTRGRGPGVRGTGSRGTVSRGVENTGSGGKHGVWWKKRGVRGKHGVYLENTRYHFFRQNMNFPHNNESMR